MTVRLHITTDQYIDGEHSRTALDLPALLFVEEGGCRLVYTQPEDMRVTLRIRPGEDEVTLTRGANASQMRFRPGARCRGTYATPYGLFDVVTHTKLLRCRLADTSGEVRLHYALEMGGGQTELHLHATWAPPAGASTLTN